MLYLYTILRKKKKKKRKEEENTAEPSEAKSILARSLNGSDEYSIYNRCSSRLVPVNPRRDKTSTETRALTRYRGPICIRVSDDAREKEAHAGTRKGVKHRSQGLRLFDYHRGLPPHLHGFPLCFEARGQASPRCWVRS